MVTLILLVFICAELIRIHNAISIVVVSNLITILTGWIAAKVGFIQNIHSFPMSAIER